ncbi:MAG: choice-of-anchor D domain-containing protein, partial [Gammaproteobacteria bacterium]|nr:choice-of-anchor D domain-containing protein [Gammaproteobacteria bacterium]
MAMRNLLLSLFGLGIVVFTLIVLSNKVGLGVEPGISKELAAEQVRYRLHDLAIPFIKNQGQSDPQINYTAHTLGGSYFVMKSGELVYIHPPAKIDSPAFAITFQLEGAHDVMPAGSDPSSTKVGYLTGNDINKWQSNVPTFNSVVFTNVYDGIHLSLRAHGNSVEQIFRVTPGAKADEIQVSISGSRKLSIENSGALAIQGSEAAILLSRPVAYQNIDGHRQPVDVAYALKDNSYTFVIGDYDRTRELMIDPLLQTTYLGGSSGEDINNITIHPTTGAVYVAGGTTSMGFGVDNLSLTHSDAYIAHLSSDLTTLIFVQFMGGTGNESVMDIAVHAAGPLAGRMIVMGPTDSTDWPATGFGTQGHDSMFVGDFGTDLQPHALKWMSGSLNDRPGALAIHPTSNDVYIAGETGSEDFPGTTGGAQPVKAGILDGFIAQLSDDLSVLKQATYIGGTNGSEVNLSIALDPVQGVYVKGRTNSWDDWPAVLTPLPAVPPQPEFGGGIEDLFVGLLETDLTAFKLVTFLGGNGIEDTRLTPFVIHPVSGKVYLSGTTKSNDFFAGIAITPGGFLGRFSNDLTSFEAVSSVSNLSVNGLLFNVSSDNLYLLGTTASGSLPGSATTGVFQPDYGGGLSDGAIAMFDANLALQAATYLGGSDYDGLTQMLIHPTTSDVYAAGYTWSTDFPMTSDGPQPVNAGFKEGFVVRMNANLGTPAQATYFGGSNNDTITALAVHPSTGDVYIGGSTDSTDLPGTAGGAQATMIMQPEVFVAQYDSTLAGSNQAADIEVTPTALDFGEIVASDSLTLTVTIANHGGADLTISNAFISFDALGWYSRDLNGPTNPCGTLPRVIPAGQYCTLTVTLAPEDFGTPSGRLTVESDDPVNFAVIVEMTGRGLWPQSISVRPDSLDFEIIWKDLGDENDIIDNLPDRPITTPAKKVIIENRGMDDLTISGIELTGENSSEFVIDQRTCELTPTRVLSPGGICSLYVSGEYKTYEPDVDCSTDWVCSRDDKTAQLNIESDDPENQVVPVPITGGLGFKKLSSDCSFEMFGSCWCFIATAAYATPMHEDVQLLRDFR